ncbi:MAG: hypothetical protein RL219_946 [Actinomycetota bacterium]|jgi:hypothetical protein
MRAGVDFDRLEQRDTRFFVREMNAFLADWANQGPNLWAIDLQTVSLTSGQVTFTAPASTVDLLDGAVVLRRAGQDYILERFSVNDYMQLPNKSQTGRPTNFWVDKTLPTYTVYLWPLTDQSSDQVRYYRMVQLQDVTNQGSQTFNLPYLYSDAICAGLAYRIAMQRAMRGDNTMSLDKVAFLKEEYKQSYFNAVKMNTDRVPLKLEPDASDYYRFG